MADRRTHRLLAEVAAIREAERSVARQALFAAQESERAASDDSARAAQAAAIAAQAWNANLTGGFHPEFALGLAREIVRREADSDAARSALRDAQQHSAQRRSQWHGSDARCRQVAETLRGSRRALARAREENALEALADRVTFDWTRP